MKQIYLDHNATTPVRREVLEAMMPYFSEEYGNASSIYSIGQKARQAIEEAREVIGNAIGTEASDIIFTSGGTEADNFAIKGIAMANLNKGRHIITSNIEHLAVLEPCRFIEKELGFDVTYLPVDKYGTIDLGRLKDAIRKDTILISIMFANNETGTIQPIKEIAKIAHGNNIYFHTDAVQAFDKLPIDVEELGIDLSSFSGHKVYGPKGIGAMYLRKGVRITPFQHGGHHEKKKRAGTENVAGIVGFAKAAEIGVREMKKAVPRMARLRNMLIMELLKISNTRLNGPKGKNIGKRLCNNANITFDFIEGEAMLMRLSMKGICVSTGSACSSKSLQPSHVLKAIGLEHEQAHGSIRFSLSKFNNEKEVRYVVGAVRKEVEELRRISAFRPGESKKYYEERKQVLED